MMIAFRDQRGEPGSQLQPSKFKSSYHADLSLDA
jgi:hypothetical protein